MEDDDQDRRDEGIGEDVKTHEKEEEVNGWKDNERPNMWWHVDENVFANTSWVSPWAMQVHVRKDEMCEKMRGVRVFCSHTPSVTVDRYQL